MDRELSIEELQERWEWFLFEVGIEQLQVTEIMQNSGVKNYVVTGLTMKFEDEYAMCNDVDDVIMTNLSALQMFFRTSLTKIILSPYQGWYRERLEFGNHGYILIELA